MIALQPVPLTKDNFASFGEVVQVDWTKHIKINQGFADRFDDLVNIDVTDEQGQVKVSLFEANPRPQPIVINIMERHPLGSQMFYPLQNRPWLVVVCKNPADASSYRAFTATGQQGVNYAKNTWHFPLLVMELCNRFIVVDRKGPGNNLEEVQAPSIFVHLPEEDKIPDLSQGFYNMRTSADDKSW